MVSKKVFVTFSVMCTLNDWSSHHNFGVELSALDISQGSSWSDWSNWGNWSNIELLEDVGSATFMMVSMSMLFAVKVLENVCSAFFLTVFVTMTMIMSLNVKFLESTNTWNAGNTVDT